MIRRRLLLIVLFAFLVLTACSGADSPTAVPPTASPMATATATAVTLPPTETVARPTETAAPPTQSAAKPTAQATINPTPAPVVVAQDPSNTTLDYPDTPIRLTFDRPLDPASTIANLKVSPQVTMETTWEENTLVITPKSSWPAGTFKITLDETAVDLAGVPLGQTLSWNYTVPAVIAETTLPDAETPDQLEIAFQWPIDSDSTEISFTPSLADAALRWSADHTHLTIHFSNSTAPTVYTEIEIAFSAGIKSTDGHALPKPANIVFPLPAFIDVYNPWGKGPVNPTTPISIVFIEPMDETATANALHVTPETQGVVTWEDNSDGAGRTLIWTPITGAWQENSSYDVVLDTTAVTSDGRPVLEAPLAWSFETTTDESLIASFGDTSPWQTIDPDGSRTIPFYFRHGGPEPITFTVAALDTQEWLAGNIVTNGPTTRWPYDLDTAQLLINSYDAYYPFQLPAEVAPGAYLLQIEDATRVEESLVIFLTKYDLSVVQGRDTLNGWVKDLSNGQGIAANITLYDGASISNQTTAEDGSFSLPHVPLASQPIRVIADVQDAAGHHHVAYAEMSHIGESIPSGLTTMPDWLKPRDLMGFITTTSPAYHAGEEIAYYAMVRQLTNTLPAGTEMTINLHPQYQSGGTSWTSLVGEYGTVNGRYPIPADTPPGAYQLSIKLGTTVIETDLTITPSLGSVHIGLPATYYDPSATIPMTVETNFPNMDIQLIALLEAHTTYPNVAPPERWQVNGRTDETGLFTATFTPLTDTNVNEASELVGKWVVMAYLNVAQDPYFSTSDHPETTGFTPFWIITSQENAVFQPDTLLHHAGQPFSVAVNVANLAGTPVEGRALTLTALHHDNGEETTAVQNVALTTDAAGQASASLNLAQPGRYTLRLDGQDAQGQAFSASQLVYVEQAGYTQSYFPYPIEPNSVRLENDRDRYVVGQTAHILIHGDVDGYGMMILNQNGGHVRTQWVDLTPPLTVVNVPLTAEDFPYLEVGFNYWFSSVPDPNSSPFISNLFRHFHSATEFGRDLEIENPSTAAQVTLTPSVSQTSAGGNVDVTVHVSNALGEPISAEVTLQLLNSDVLNSYPQNESVFRDAFRVSLLSDNFNMGRGDSQLWWQRIDDPSYDECCYGGQVPYEILVYASGEYDNTNLTFTGLITDADGNVIISIPMPTVPATWQLRAYATTADTQTGTAVVQLITQ